MQELTPKCKRLYSKCINIIKSKRQLLGSYKNRLAKAQKMCDNNTFNTLIEQMTPPAKTFLAMQFTQVNKHIKQRRFSNEQKLLALSLLKQSPKGYRLLQRMFILPSRRTLSKFTENVKFRPGIHTGIQNQLRETVESWDDVKKCCSIIFDEVALNPHTTFVECEDRIEGFIDFGDETEKKFCDHALVFMIRGICATWRQPFAYYLCEGTTPTIKLKSILKV